MRHIILLIAVLPLLGMGWLFGHGHGENDGTSGVASSPESVCDPLSVDFCTDFEGPDNWDCADSDATTPQPEPGNSGLNCSSPPYADGSQTAPEGSYDGSSDDWVYSIEEVFDGGTWLKLYHETNVDTREGGLGTDGTTAGDDVQIAACLRIVAESINDGDEVNLIGNFSDPDEDDLVGLSLQQNAGELQIHHTDGGDCNQALVLGDVYEVNLYHGDVRSGAGTEDVKVWFNGVEKTSCGVTDGDITDVTCGTEGCWGAKSGNTNGVENSNNSYSFSLGVLAVDYANDGTRIDLDCNSSPAPPISVSSVTADPSSCTIGTDCAATDIAVETSASDGPTCDYRVDCDDSDGTGSTDASALDQVCPSFTLTDVCNFTAPATYTVTVEVTDDGDGSTDTGQTSVNAIDPGETDPPTPDPATFASDPTALSYQQIDMTVTTASDASPPVEYRVTLEDDTEVCGWSTDADCSHTGLTEQTEYCYEPYARDSLGNVTSEPLSAVCETTPSQPAAGTCETITVETDAYLRAGPTSVTWTFDQAYECGTFANGHDWWVKTPTPSGTVQVVSVSPDWDGTRHGLMVDPDPDGDNIAQGWDARRNYSSSVNLALSLPYDASAGESLVKAYGREGTECFGGRGYIESLSVLTVVSATPAGGGADVFRPPYVAGPKPQHPIADADCDLLPDLDPAVYGGPYSHTYSDASSVYRTAANVLNGTVVYQHTASCLAQQGGYGGYAVQAQFARLLMLLFAPGASPDFGTEAEKTTACHDVIQRGIDTAYSVGSGWTSDGGGAHGVGVKLPAVLAAHLLDDATMRGYLVSPPGGLANAFHENAQVLAGDGGQALYGREASLGNCGSKTRWDWFRELDGKQDYYYIHSASWMTDMAFLLLMPAMETEWGYDLFMEFMNRRYADGLLRSPDPDATERASSECYTLTSGPDGIGDEPDGHDSGMDQQAVGGSYHIDEIRTLIDDIVPCAPTCP